MWGKDLIAPSSSFRDKLPPGTQIRIDPPHRPSPRMPRNILELKSIRIAPEKVQTLASAKRMPKLKDFDLREEFFDPVYHPEDLVQDIAYYVEGDTYEANVRVADIKGTLHPSYYGNNWLVMMMSLQRHTEDFDVEAVRAAILNTKCFEPIHLRKYGSIYFIDGGGNHRVCQAKFLGMESVLCVVTEYVFYEKEEKERFL